MTAGTHVANFQLLTDNVTTDNNLILTVQVCDDVSGQTLGSLDITRQMFTTASQYQNFGIAFVATPGQILEFRTYWWGGAYVRQNSVTVQ